MDDTLANNRNDGAPNADTVTLADNVTLADTVSLANSVMRVLTEHKAVAPVTLDLRRFNLWTDFFVVAGVTSAAHLDGLKRHLEEWADENHVAYRRSSRRGAGRRSSGVVPGEPSLLWDIVDMGNVVVHLMSQEAREFYELEKLWL
jgi:ribosome-associated protein